MFSLYNLLLVGLFLVILITRILRLGIPASYYFDEVYHAFTAQAYAQNDPRGYEWWNTAPKGFAYEWLHPPLAKLIQAGSIKLLGDTPFSWRFPGVIFGVGVGYLLYLFGKNIMKSPRLGLLALTLWTFDGLSLTMSRITMNDIFLTFWVLLAFYFYFLKKPAPQIGIVLGLALATKWSGAFALGILAFLWFARGLKERSETKKLLTGAFSFLVIPVAIYFLSYTQFFLQGHTMEQFRQLHQQVWWYQTGLTATHPYSSAPFEWALMRRPIYAYTKGFNGRVANTYLMGNPLLFWAGLVAAVYVFGYLIRKRIKKRLTGQDFVLVAVFLFYSGMFLPWVSSPRIMFLYHYLPALPFLFLLLAWGLNKLWGRRKKFWVASFLLLTLIVFVFFYPHWTGLPVTVEIDRLYYWFTSWR